MRGLRSTGGSVDVGAGLSDGLGEGDYYGSDDEDRIFPFELEMLEGALMVATGAMWRLRCMVWLQRGAARHALLLQLCMSRWTLLCSLPARSSPRLADSIPTHPRTHPPTSPSNAALCRPPPAGKLDAELVAATRRVSGMLQKLPREITPVNLEELRRVKQMLVELESKAENMR